MATTRNPDVRAPALLAEALFKMGDLDGAQSAVRIALERDPRNRLALKLQRVLSG